MPISVLVLVITNLIWIRYSMRLKSRSAHHCQEQTSSGLRSKCLVSYCNASMKVCHDARSCIVNAICTIDQDNYTSTAVVSSGLVATMDVTSVLATKGFWPSYNIAYIPEIYQWSGYPANRSSPSGYDGAPRARYAVTITIWHHFRGRILVRC